MPHRLREASLHVSPGHSVVVPLVIEGLPDQIAALGRPWWRKREFHLTVAGADLLERARAAPPDRAGADGAWERVQAVLSGRSIGPVAVGAEVRRAVHPTTPDLETLVVMVNAPGLARIYEELSVALGARLEVPPAHITLYSTEPTEGVGLSDAAELAERAPPLSEAQQHEARNAMNFEEVFFDDDGIPFFPGFDDVLALGLTDAVFTPRVMRALAYAAHVHRQDRRKGTSIPYLAHLLSVSALVAEDGGGETEVIGALLHDTAEDRGGEKRLADVRRRFGDDVEALVRGLSDALVPEGETKPPWRPRKEEYLDHLRHSHDCGVLRISNADKLHNARAILADYRQVGEELWARFTAPAADQLWYYGELASIFSERRAGSALAQELVVAVAHLQAEVEGRTQ